MIAARAQEGAPTTAKARRVEPLRVFFACPITGLLDASGRLPADYEHFIREVYAILASESDGVFLALEREKWGEAVMPAEVCTPLDFAEMQACSIVVAYPGTSHGVCVELGWASALGKPIVLLAAPDSLPTPLIDGLAYLPGASVEHIPVNEPPSRRAAHAIAASLLDRLRRFDAQSEPVASRVA